MTNSEPQVTCGSIGASIPTNTKNLRVDKHHNRLSSEANYFKRPLSVTSSETSSPNQQANLNSNANIKINTNNKPKVAKSHKKKKLEVSIEEKMSEIEKALEPGRSIFNDSENSMSFNFEQFVNFVKNTYQSPNVFKEVQNLSEKKSEVIDLISKVHPIVTVSSVKSKLTRIKNKLTLNNFDETSQLSASEHSELDEFSENEI